MRNQFFLVWAVFFLVTGCASEEESGADNVVEEEDVSLNPLEQLDVVSVDVTDVEAPEPDVEEEDGDEGDGYVAPEFACSESKMGSLPSGEGMIYSCLSTSEGLPYQAIRQLDGATGEIRTRALVANPERLGIQLEVRDGWGYFDTALIESDEVTARRIYRFNLADGEVELVREFTTYDFSQVGFDIQFTQTSQSFLFLVQPGGTRIAFQMVDPVTKVGQGPAYVFDEADPEVMDTITLGQEGTVRRISWNQDGNQLLFTAVKSN